MSNINKDKTCVYCVERVSITTDHIFAREFFLKEERDNLPQVPACKRCNNKKSQLEHYLTAVLPFGGEHSRARENLAEMVPKRLAKNKKLHTELRNGMSYIGTGKSRRLVLPMRQHAIPELFNYIAKGTTWFHWQTMIPSDSYIKSMGLTDIGQEFFKYLLSLSTKNRINNTIGNGTFSYVGSQADNPEQMTVWVFEIYGGLAMKSRDFPKSIASKIGVITGPPEIEEDVGEILKGRYKWKDL